MDKKYGPKIIGVVQVVTTARYLLHKQKEVARDLKKHPTSQISNDSDNEGGHPKLNQG